MAYPYNPFGMNQGQDSIKLYKNYPNRFFTPSPENGLESQIESELIHGIDPSVPTTNFIDIVRNKYSEK